MVVGGLGAMQMQMQMQFCMHLRRQHSTMPVKAASILRVVVVLLRVDILRRALRRHYLNM